MDKLQENHTLRKVLEKENQVSIPEATDRFISIIGKISLSPEAVYVAEDHNMADVITVITSEDEKLLKELYKGEDQLQRLYPSLAFTFTVVSRESPDSDQSLTLEQVEQKITSLFPKAKRIFPTKIGDCCGIDMAKPSEHKCKRCGEELDTYCLKCQEAMLSEAINSIAKEQRTDRNDLQARRNMVDEAKVAILKGENKTKWLEWLYDHAQQRVKEIEKNGTAKLPGVLN